MAAAVDSLGHARIMRGDEKRRAGALLQGRETIEQSGGRSRIEAGGRFVGQDDGRFGDEGARGGNPLLLAAGKSRRAMMLAMRKTDPRQGGTRPLPALGAG